MDIKEVFELVTQDWVIKALYDTYKIPMLQDASFTIRGEKILLNVKSNHISDIIIDPLVNVEFMPNPCRNLAKAFNGVKFLMALKQLDTTGECLKLPKISNIHLLNSYFKNRKLVKEDECSCVKLYKSDEEINLNKITHNLSQHRVSFLGGLQEKSDVFVPNQSHPTDVSKYHQICEEFVKNNVCQLILDNKGKLEYFSNQNVSDPFNTESSYINVYQKEDVKVYVKHKHGPGYYSMIEKLQQILWK